MEGVGLGASGGRTGVGLGDRTRRRSDWEGRTGGVYEGFKLITSSEVITNL